MDFLLTERFVLFFVALMLLIFVLTVLWMMFKGVMHSRNNKSLLKQMNSAVSHIVDTIKSKSVFERSVEFDLHSSGIWDAHLSSYEIEELIFEGANSLVFRLSSIDGGAFTLKAMMKKAQIHYDVDALSQMAFDSLPKLVKYFDSDKFHYFVKEYVPGSNLYEFIKKNPTLDEQSKLQIVVDLCAIIDAFHKAMPKLLYRDLKPENIIIDEGGVLRLVDIESMRVYKTGQETDTFYVTSRGYSPPEQYGFRQTDERSDIYSLGAVMFFIFTGERPVHDRVFSDEVVEKWPADPELLTIIRKCMAYDPGKRYGSVDELVGSVFLTHFAS